MKAKKSSGLKKQKKYNKCESCGKRKEDVELVENPWMLELYQESVLEYLCEQCYEIILGDT